MLGKKSRSQAPIGTLVGSDTRIQGDIEFTGGCHIDGYVKGNVRAASNPGGVLSVSERGCVEGSVVAPHVQLNGTVKGDVRATERIELGPKARVVGNVQYKLIEMSIGAKSTVSWFTTPKAWENRRTAPISRRRAATSAPSERPR